ncbi:MAG: aminoglycoside phosphotransferase family protein [Bacteroidales bacterium]|nr:aminoglycoside phosphotransferase family protein [Bacteroidales bacterium]MCF8389475.1 aminoglycoside phosphotransferase family protein [Bacteroidales bacterium]
MEVESIFESFETNGSFLNSKEFGEGNIHKTWMINTSESSVFILQKFNNLVFRDPDGLMQNTFLISNHLAKKVGIRNLNWEFPNFYKTKKGDLFYKEEESYWRLMDYIDHDPDAGNNDRKYFNAGKSYGQFIELLSDLPVELIRETIPDFHNLPFRIKNFKEAVDLSSAIFRQNSNKEIKYLLNLEHKMLQVPELASSGLLPRRLVHMDPKLDNILFDRNANPVAIIDLDTVMPGIVHSDFGDALRSFGNTAAEDEPDVSKVSFNLNVFEDFSRGFAESLKTLLLPVEIETLHLAPAIFAYMQSIRFLSDYLQGSKYYNIKYPSHNLVRTRNQICLLEDILRNENEMKVIIEREFNS